MPNNQLGYSFAPTFENAEIAQRGGAPASSPQEAIQVLSYRLPRVRGAQGISPLLTDERMGGANMAVLESVFRTILGPEAAAALMGHNGELSSSAKPPTGSPGAPGVRPGGIDIPLPFAPGAPSTAPPPDQRAIAPRRPGLRDPVEDVEEPFRRRAQPGRPAPSTNPFANGALI